MGICKKMAILRCFFKIMQSYKNDIRIPIYNGSPDALQSNSVVFTYMSDSISISQCGIIFGEVIQHWGATQTHFNNHRYYRIDLQIDIWVFLHGSPTKITSKCKHVLKQPKRTEHIIPMGTSFAFKLFNCFKIKIWC